MKNAKKIIIASMCLLLLTGCGEKTIPKLENGQEAVVTLKDDKKISVNDLYNKLKETYGLQALITMIDKTILEDKYNSEIDGAKSSAQTQMDQLKASYGDELLSAIQYYTDFNTLEEYQDSLYLNYLQQKAITDYAKTKISDSDINKYYKDEIKPDIKISHILITADYASDASTEDKTKAEDEAKKKAEDLIKELDKASDKAETFKTLAKENSKDDSTKEDGGNLGFVNTNTLGANYKEMIDEAYKLKDNEYTKTPVKSELGYHIVYRSETKEKAKLEDVKDTILDSLASKYITDNQDASIKAMQELRKEYNMDIIDSEVHDNYVNYIQNSLAKIQKEKNNTDSKK